MKLRIHYDGGVWESDTLGFASDETDEFVGFEGVTKLELVGGNLLEQEVFIQLGIADAVDDLEMAYLCMRYASQSDAEACHLLWARATLGSTKDREHILDTASNDDLSSYEGVPCCGIGPDRGTAIAGAVSKAFEDTPVPLSDIIAGETERMAVYPVDWVKQIGEQWYAVERAWRCEQSPY